MQGSKSLPAKPRPPTPSRSLPPAPSTPPPPTPSPASAPSSLTTPPAATSTTDNPSPKPLRPTRPAPTPGGRSMTDLKSGSSETPLSPGKTLPPTPRGGSTNDITRVSPSIPPRPSPSPPSSQYNASTNGNATTTTPAPQSQAPPLQARQSGPLRPVSRLTLSNSDGNITTKPDTKEDPKEIRPGISRVSSARESVNERGTLSKANSFRQTQNGSLRGGISSPAESSSPTTERAEGGEDGLGEDDGLNVPIRTDFNALRKLDDDPRRANSVLEILKTEETYINNVEQMIKNYKGPLVTMAMTHPEFNVEEIRAMFSNIHLILPLNQELLKDISARVDNWSPSQKLGDIFLRMAPFLKMYNDYSNNYKQALHIYNHYNATSEKFQETLALCKATCKPPLNLESFLINPIQRIPRYNLLIDELLKHTEPTHPDYQDLTKALALMKDVATHINQNVKKTENLRKLAEASTKGTGFKGLMKAHRQLMKDGVLPTVDNKGHKERLHFFLFNDILVFANKSDLKKQKDMTKVNSQWPINLVWHTSSATGFELIGPNRIFTINSLPPDENEAWVKEINKALSELDGEKREGEFDFGPMKYEGEWLKGKIHGNGTLTSFGTTYTGQFSQGKKSGEGTLVYTTNDWYQGQWVNDLQNGQGTLTLTNGARYEGGWKDGKKHGQGIFTFENGDKYVGGWRDDLAHGEGKLTLHYGASYEGMWENGRFHGKGTLVQPNGKSYVGDFVEGLKEGNGVMTYGNGDRYEGQWKQDKRHGTGTFTSPGWESKYVGAWVSDKKEGNGTMIYLDGSQYEGQWKNDLPHGKGVLTKANKDVHQGQFKLGVPHGAGVLTYASSGMEYNGKWDMGVRESGKVTLSRQLTEEEKKIVQANPKDNNVLDKISGSYNPKECTVSSSFNGDSFDVAVVPELPNFSFSM